MSIAEQFYGKMEVAKWIEDSFDLIGPLVNKIKIPEVYISGKGIKTDDMEYWMIGPLKNKPGKLFLYGAAQVSHTEEIRSINPTADGKLLVVTGFDTVRRLDINKSATRIAQTLDMLLHGHYTDIPPLHIDSILGEIERYI